MNTLQKIITAIRFSGLKTSLRTIRYSLMRDRLDRIPRASSQPVSVTLPGRLQNIKKVRSGARLQYEQAELEIIFLASDLARISWGPAPEPIAYALAKTEWPDVPVRLEQQADQNLISSTELTIQVDPLGSIHYRTIDGDLLRREDPPMRQGEGWSQRASLAVDEHLYGLGHQTGRLDLRGKSYKMWNTDPGGSYGPGDEPVYKPIPVYLSLHAGGSYLIFYENYYPGQFQFDPAGQTGYAQAVFEAGMLRTYFVPGPPELALARYTELTGRSELPPRWVLGYHQCRWGYRTEADIREVADGFRQRGWPISAIHLDIDYMDGYRVFTVDRQRFPDLAGLSRSLSESDDGSDPIRLVTIIDPGVKVDSKYATYRNGLKLGVYCLKPNGKPLTGLVWPDWSVFPDFTNPETRRWWGEQYPFLLDQGIAGFWHDMNEPTSFSAWGDITLPLSTRHDLDGTGGDHRAGHNLYALLMNRSAHEALRRLRPDQRPWMFTRSAWAGIQRYAWNWTGDIQSTWEALRMSIPSIVGLSLSGMGMTGPDIGGFSGDPPAELYLRWFQMAAFLPLFRTHSAIGTARREPWVFGEPYTSILGNFLHLRYQLLPYLYTQVWKTNQTGQPFVRPLWWSDPSNSDFWDADDAFLCGPDLLVAPVFEPQAQTRTIHLPEGEWYDYWDNLRYTGPGSIEIPTRLEHIPLLVRAGSILPLATSGQLDLHVYLPRHGQGQGVLFSDAGDGYGDWRLDEFLLERKGDQWVIRWESQGNYSFPYHPLILHLHGGTAQRLWLDGQQIPTLGTVFQVPMFQEIKLDIKEISD
jgi:alpha-glucosidase